MKTQKIMGLITCIFIFNINISFLYAETNTDNQTNKSGNFQYITSKITKIEADEPTENNINLPIGMNIPAITYYDSSLVFNDVMKTSDLRASGIDVSGLDRDLFAEFPADENGYPTEVPYTIDGHQYEYVALINSLYTGEHALLYDGEGSVSISGVSSTEVDGVTRFTLPGIKKNIWITVSNVTQGNHVKNIRIIPVEYLGNEDSMPVFRSDFVAGLQPFHSLRFMDLTRTNNSDAVDWSDRVTKDWITQGSEKGIAWEYVIELSNLMNVMPWICVPHMATDDYITSLATLFKENIRSDLKVYVEYSNEVWNTIFDQTHWISNNGVYTNPWTGEVHPSAAQELQDALSAIGEAGSNYPEKDAYMMARTFRLFNEVFGDDSTRIVRVAAGQAGWPSNSGRILEYLFETDGIGADAFAVGGYFYFNPDDHDIWNAMDPDEVTPEMIIQSAEDYYPTKSATNITNTAAYVNQYGIDYLVYEGGQHIQPYNQGDWDYNHAVWDAQIHPGMYDLYMENFKIHLKPDINCKLFMAFSYVGTRQSKYGSWGHLENLQQLNTPETLMIKAPKYKALLDINTPR